MSTFNIYDRANEFRIEIIGRFMGQSVDEVAATWKRVLQEFMPRSVTIDISRLRGYDSAGRKLLCDMYQHGTQFAASTPDSLGFLSEISKPLRRGPLLVHEFGAPTSVPKTAETETVRSAQFRAARAGK